MNQFAAVSCHGRQHQPQQRCEVDAHKFPFLGTPPQIHHCRCPGSGRGSQIPRLHQCKCISDWTKGYMAWQLRVKIHIHLIHALCNWSFVQSIIYLWKEHTFPFSYRSLRFARNASSVISSSRMKSGCPNSAGSESAIVVLLQEENGIVHCKRDVLSADKVHQLCQILIPNFPPASPTTLAKCRLQYWIETIILTSKYIFYRWGAMSGGEQEKGAGQGLQIRYLPTFSDVSS